MGTPKIQAVILDLGGVIARIDPERTIAGIYRFVSPERIGDDGMKSCTQLIFRYESGQCGTREFLESLQQLIRRKNPDLPASSPSLSELTEIWNEMLVDIPPQNLETLVRIRKRYPLYLLSNTNALHIDHLDFLIPEEKRPFQAYFDGLFYSFEMKLHKPDPAIYRAVCQSIGLAPQNCLFIDDRQENIEGARQAGLTACRLDGFDLPERFDAEGNFSE